MISVCPYFGRAVVRNWLSGPGGYLDGAGCSASTHTTIEPVHTAGGSSTSPHSHTLPYINLNSYMQHAHPLMT